MNPQFVIRRLKNWFEAYVKGFYSDDPFIQKNMDLKAEHTLRVCEAILDIGRTLNLSSEDLCLAEVSALLHDIGRFEQFERYRTFSDYRSEDHAALGVKVIEGHHVLQDLEPDMANIILRAVEYHNRAALPEGEDDRALFFMKLLRDADKIDILRVVTDYYQNGGPDRNPSIELGLPDIDKVTDSVCSVLLRGKTAQMSKLKTLNDFKLLQIGWVYDMNFPRSFQIVRERRYLEKILDTISLRSDLVMEVYNRASAYLEQNTHGPPRLHDA
ncbi:MAG: HD domain-containing protein [Deltaproteobacteria bacterium]|nr:HD domain-containing protein [Deltaproteobacteria bacterium]